MTTIKDIIKVIEDFAPPSLQESYDNSGLLTGNKSSKVTKVILTLDCTEEVVNEAIETGCNLIVAHHPIIFSGLKSLTGKNYVERTIIKAIKNDIAIYACHTNLDHVKYGVNYKICSKLGLKNLSILSPKSNTLLKLETYCPQNATQSILKALNKAGAGEIGNYSACSFTTVGTGRFTGNESSNPTIGTQKIPEEVIEDKIELLVPIHLQYKIISALKESHPYEEIAYYLQPIINQPQEIGSGMIGELENEMDVFEFFDLIKSEFQVQYIKHTNIVKNKIKRVAVCGGAGSFLLKNAINAKADIFLTSDFKYHEFFDAENKLVITDIGHYETESCTKELFFEIISEKFVNIALVFSKSYTNPVKYY